MVADILWVFALSSYIYSTFLGYSGIDTRYNHTFIDHTPFRYHSDGAATTHGVPPLPSAPPVSTVCDISTPGSQLHQLVRYLLQSKGGAETQLPAGL